MNISLYFVRSPPDESLRGFLRLLFFIFKVKIFLRKKAKNVFFNQIRIEPDTDIHKKAISDKLITSEHNLLPKTSSDLKSLFYKNPRTKYIDTVIGAILLIKKEIKKGKNAQISIC